MPCQNCPKEGQTTIPQTVVGFKIWYADGSKKIVTIDGRTKTQVLADIAALPKTGLQIVMLYYNRFSTDGNVRYRKILQGNDIYYFVWDSFAPLTQQDWIFGQTNTAADLLNYIDPVQITGSSVNDAWYKTLSNQAMNDFNITEFGITPELGTSDV